MGMTSEPRASDSVSFSHSAALSIPSPGWPIFPSWQFAFPLCPGPYAAALAVSPSQAEESGWGLVAGEGLGKGMKISGSREGEEEISWLWIPPSEDCAEEETLTFSTVMGGLIAGDRTRTVVISLPSIYLDLSWTSFFTLCCISCLLL